MVKKTVLPDRSSTVSTGVRVKTDVVFLVIRLHVGCLCTWRGFPRPETRFNNNNGPISERMRQNNFYDCSHTRTRVSLEERIVANVSGRQIFSQRDRSRQKGNPEWLINPLTIARCVYRNLNIGTYTHIVHTFDHQFGHVPTAKTKKKITIFYRAVAKEKYRLPDFLGFYLFVLPYQS